MRISYILLLVLGGVLALIVSRLEPSPGRAAMLMEIFSGDWSIKIGSTEYEIGNAADGTIDRFDVWRWTQAPDFIKNDIPSGRDMLVATGSIRDVIDYNSDAKWIVLSTDYGFTWIDTSTHDRSQAKDISELRKQAPIDVVKLLDGLHTPRPSRRGVLTLLGMVLIIWAFVILLKIVLEKYRRTTKCDCEMTQPA